MKVTSTQINKFVLALGIMSIPMNPVYTTYGFNISLVLLVALTVLNIILRGGRVRFSDFDVMFVIFITFNVLSLLWSISGYLIIIKMLSIYFIMAFSIGYLLFLNFESKEAVDFYIKWYVIGTVLVSIICLIYEWPNYLGNIRLGKVLFEEPYGTFMMYSYSLQISAIMIIYKLIVSDKKIINVLLLLLLTACILFNGSRKVLAGLFLFYFIASFIYNKKRTLKLLKISLGILVVGLVLYYFLMNNEILYNSYGYRIEAYLNFRNTGSGDVSASERSILIANALKYFYQRPIFGWGSHSFAYLSEVFLGKNIYSHNNFVELLCDLGIIGFILYYAFYAKKIVSMIKMERTEKYSGDKHIILFLAGMITLLILDYWTISYYRIQFLLFLEVTTLYVYHRKKECANANRL